MKIIADLHLHSKYSRAVSPKMVLEEIDKWIRQKGIGLVNAPDFTHPTWFRELKEKLEPAEPGLYRLKSNSSKSDISKEPRFILGTEISCIYSKNGKVRRIHTMIYAPSFEVAQKINNQLSWIGNLKADGRPILGLDAKELAKIAFSASPDCLVIPAHVWTPWFSLFGSKSGFDSLKECFEELAPKIPAIETGLSSDPAMNWRIEELDNKTIISGSDAHSLSHIGREANVFEIEPGSISYNKIASIIKEKDHKKFLYTIEFFPEEGMYHFDGHRSCKVSFSPKETKKHNGICPACGKPVTVGVMNRVGELASPDRKEGFQLKGAIPYKSLIPLEEIIAESFEMGVKTKTVMNEYNNLINQLGSEFHVLLDVEKEKIMQVSDPKIAEAIMRVREGKVEIEPGYDGVYGKIKIFQKNEDIGYQKSLF